GLRCSGSVRESPRRRPSSARSRGRYPARARARRRWRGGRQSRCPSRRYPRRRPVRAEESLWYGGGDVHGFTVLPGATSASHAVTDAHQVFSPPSFQPGGWLSSPPAGGGKACDKLTAMVAQTPRVALLRAPKVRAAAVSVAASLAVLALKFFAYVITGSVAVLSDAVE